MTTWFATPRRLFVGIGMVSQLVFIALSMDAVVLYRRQSRRVLVLTLEL